MDRLRVRAMTEDEVDTLQRWARTRKGSVRLAERVRLLRTQETWFGERVDPQFAAKRGKSSGSARPRLRAV